MGLCKEDQLDVCELGSEYGKLCPHFSFKYLCCGDSKAICKGYDIMREKMPDVYYGWIKLNKTER
jgi:hypothetical protein